MTERHVGVTIVHILLEDVAQDPSRLERAMRIAERDLTPLFKPTRRTALQYMAYAVKQFNKKS